MTFTSLIILFYKNFMKKFTLFLLVLFFLTSCDSDNSTGESEPSKNSSSSENVEKESISGNFSLTGDNTLTAGETKLYTIDLSGITPDNAENSSFTYSVKSTTPLPTEATLVFENNKLKLTTTANSVTVQKDYTIVATVDSSDIKYTGSVEANLNLTINAPKTSISGSFSLTGDNTVIAGQTKLYTIDLSGITPNDAESSTFTYSVKSTTPLPTEATLIFENDKLKLTTTANSVATQQDYTIVATVNSSDTQYKGSVEGTLSLTINAIPFVLTSSASDDGFTPETAINTLTHSIANNFFNNGDFPKITWSGVPTGTTKLVLILQDNMFGSKGSSFGNHGVWVIAPSIAKIDKITGSGGASSASIANSNIEALEVYRRPGHNGGGANYVFKIYATTYSSKAEVETALRSDKKIIGSGSDSTDRIADADTQMSSKILKTAEVYW